MEVAVEWITVVADVLGSVWVFGAFLAVVLFLIPHRESREYAANGIWIYARVLAFSVGLRCCAITIETLEWIGVGIIVFTLGFGGVPAGIIIAFVNRDYYLGILLVTGFVAASMLWGLAVWIMRRILTSEAEAEE